MKLRVGFGYEQATLDDSERMWGFYIYDEETGLVVMSEDVEPSFEVSREIMKQLNKSDNDQ